MNTFSFAGVLQRLTIVQQTKTKLILRELPLLDWAIVFGLVITSLIIYIASFWVTALIAFFIGVYFALQGRVRMVYFDADSHMLTVEYQSPIQKEVATQVALNEIKRAYLFKGDDGGTQVILVHDNGEEMGMSVYSTDMHPWKDDIVIAINAILYEAHKDDAIE